mgnify:CR=1 FL=1
MGDLLYRQEQARHTLNRESMPARSIRPGFTAAWLGLAVSLVLTKPGIAGDDPLAFCAMVLEATGTGIAVSHLPEFQKMHAQD